MGRADIRVLIDDPLPVVLRRPFPRGVDEALSKLPEITLDVVDVDESVEPSVLVTFRWDDRLLTERLRWVQAVSAGLDQFPLARLGEAGVVLTSASGIHTIPVAEHALALLLALSRGIGVAMRDASTRVWKPRMGAELSGRTVGILGLGAIGTAVGERCRAMGMDVIGVRRRPELGHPVATEVHGPEEVRTVFERSDAIVSVLPGGSETDGLIGRAEFEALGWGWFVNVGRGTVVDEGALVSALEDGTIRGAGLDVFAAEPLPADSPLWDHPQVVITPHTAGLSPAYGARLAGIVRHNVAAYRGEVAWINRAI